MKVRKTNNKFTPMETENKYQCYSTNNARVTHLAQINFFYNVIY